MSEALAGILLGLLEAAAAFAVGWYGYDVVRWLRR